MKGHMQDGKFHPHTDYKKGTRKSRDQKEKTKGVKVRKQRLVAEGKDTKKHISTRLILAIDNLSRTLDRGRGGLKGTKYNGSMDYWHELRYRADDVSELIQEENIENEMVTSVPQDVIDELRLKRDSTERKARDEPLQPFVKKNVAENLADLNLFLKDLREEKLKRQIEGKPIGIINSELRLIGGARQSIFTLLEQVPEPLHREIVEDTVRIEKEMIT